jgi:hypothetical protein
MPYRRASSSVSADFGEPLAQRAAFDVLHRDKGAAIRVAHFVDGADVRVIERGGIPGLAQQTIAGGSVIDAGAEHLERNLSMERGVVCEEDGPHPSATERPLDVVGAQPRSGLKADGWLL